MTQHGEESLCPGDAENLPFEDNSFDAIINVESSHCYGNVEQFLREVHRVLRPGGDFLFVDLRGAQKLVELQTMVEDFDKEGLLVKVGAFPACFSVLYISAFRSRGIRQRTRCLFSDQCVCVCVCVCVVSGLVPQQDEKDITPNVLRALEMSSIRKEDFINTKITGVWCILRFILR